MTALIVAACADASQPQQAVVDHLAHPEASRPVSTLLGHRSSVPSCCCEAAGQAAEGYISLTACCRALSMSFGSTLSSWAVCFSALVTAFLIASSTLLSPTMTSPACPGSMKSPAAWPASATFPPAGAR